ncbi:hypothetical protein [Levilactobacillus mulengensis]|uniref:hypothetical protein n=1 Tax=Levilactobacillus mulengensis TaxID=2486025 RepID=UPI0013DE1453|nr:hypothetical protein [Levilactobacillus mulengensis]
MTEVDAQNNHHQPESTDQDHEKLTGLEEALADVKAGRVTTFSSVEEFFAFLDRPED